MFLLGSMVHNSPRFFVFLIDNLHNILHGVALDIKQQIISLYHNYIFFIMRFRYRANMEIRPDNRYIIIGRLMTNWLIFTRGARESIEHTLQYSNPRDIRLPHWHTRYGIGDFRNIVRLLVVNSVPWDIETPKGTVNVYREVARATSLYRRVIPLINEYNRTRNIYLFVDIRRIGDELSILARKISRALRHYNSVSPLNR